MEHNADLEAGVETEVEAKLKLQTARRAEALDVLAQIELRFSLLPETLCVENLASVI